MLLPFSITPHPNLLPSRGEKVALGCRISKLPLHPMGGEGRGEGGVLGRGKLQLVQSVIVVEAGEEIILSSMLHNPTMMQDQDAVSLLYG